MTIPLGGKKAAGRVALVDDEDYELVSRHGWSLWEKIRENGRNDGPYAQAGIPGGTKGRTTIRMHKLITGWPLTDHINGNGLDNRRENLRPATHSESARNRRSFIGKSSQYKGVSWLKTYRCWIAYINVNGKRTYLGHHHDETSAALAYDAAARRLHGPYALLNFPDHGLDSASGPCEEQPEDMHGSTPVSTAATPRRPAPRSTTRQR